jgi:DNA excision repair protein ERCC-2
MKVSGLVSRELERECIVVFDEAHNIDNVCIEALSVNLRQQTLDNAGRNLTRLKTSIERAKETDSRRLRAEYSRLVQGLADQGLLQVTARTQHAHYIDHWSVPLFRRSGRIR